MPDDASPPPPSDPGRADADRADADRADADPRARSRRRFLRQAGLGGAALLTGGAAAHQVLPHEAGAAEASPHAASVGAGPGGSIGGADVNLYGHGLEPPRHLPATALDHLTIAPPPDGGDPGAVHDVTFTVTRLPIQVAEGVPFDAWAYEASVPGPTLRATEGDRLLLTVRNRTDHDHNLHLHGRHSPQQDGWEPIPPGQDHTYDVRVGPAGLHPYHCHTPPLAQHVARGLYGAMIVDPVPARPPAHEFVLTLGAFDVDGDGRNEVYAFNGVAGFFTKFPIKVPVGELVRLYVTNMVEYDPVASFHLHAQTFDVYPTGTATQPRDHTDTVTLGQGERVVLEFRLRERGRYMFHPHQHHMASAGAMGWFSAI